MRALSLWEPHGTAIMLELKSYETRPWQTSYRGPIAIHCSKREFRHKDYDLSYYQEVGRRFKEVDYPLYSLNYGIIVCTCDLVDCVPTAKVRGHLGYKEFWGDFRDIGDDGKPRFAFKLENVRMIPSYLRPKVIGRQGFFYVADDLIRFA